MSRLLPILFLCASAHSVFAAGQPFAFGSVRFEANRGQADSSVRYIARARGQQIFFTDSGVMFSPPSGPAIRMSFAGSGRPEWAAEGPSRDSISYYVGKDPRKWVKGAPVYDRITWRGVYRGVDVTFYGDSDRLEYDLVLAPGADPTQVRLQFASPARVRGNAGAVLEISDAGTTIHQRVPAIFQETASGVRRKIAGDFQTAGPNAAALKIASYDSTKRLVVDPVIEMATYLGGENDDEIVALADGYVAGNTRSIAFPPAQPTLRAGRDVFVRGLGSPIPGQLPRNAFYGTIIFGGSGDEELAGIALQSTQGYVSVAGTTTSQDLPGTAASKYNGGASDGFLTMFAVSQGNAFPVSAQYIGGSGEDRITAFSGGDYTHAMVGLTDSPDLPVTSDVPQKSLGGGKDAFYGIVSPNANYKYYGYLGGSGDDAAYAVSVRGISSVWIGGETRSSDFPSTGAGLSGPSDAFLAEVYVPVGSPNSSVVTVATYRLGGNGEDSIRALAAQPSTMISSLASSQLLRPFSVTGIGFAGATTSTDLPVRNAAFPQLAGARDVFAGMWDATAAAPQWLTYLGGSSSDDVTAVTMDWAGDLYLGGWTRSTDLPVVRALQPGSAGGDEGLFAIFDGNGAVQHLTYFGGTGDDRIRDVKLIYGFVARVAGSTTSTDLPQRSPAQDRGGRTEGFWTDIGTDYLIGPTELILAKDGVLPFSVRTGRTMFRIPVTYSSSDPSRVRLVYLGSSYDEVTAAPEDNIAVEALTDSGEATITMTAPGFASKEIRVKLYPGVFTQAYSAANPISTWASPSNIFASYRAMDPATGQLVGVSSMGFRAGVPQPVINWSVSDPSLFEIVNTGGLVQLRVLKPGDATLRLTVEGYTVLQTDRTITAANPRPLSSNMSLRLGRNLYVDLPLKFGLNGTVVTTGYRGTLTARSSDPGRLLLSLDAGQPGGESVTITMSGGQPPIYAQALAGDGTVQILLTSSEFEGEIPMNVTLEPATVKWGSSRYVQSVGTVVDPFVSLTAGVQATALTFTLQGESGSTASGYRPGTPPVTLMLSNSDPKIVELNRLTRPVTSSFYSVFGLAPGSSDLTLTTNSDELRPVNESVHVEVVAPKSAAVLADLPAILYVGKGLQTAVRFRYPANQQAVDIVSGDTNAVVLSPSMLVLGSDHLSVMPPQPYSDEYTFFVQGLRSDGETTLRLRFPTGEEREIRVSLLPSGVGFTASNGSPAGQGFDRSARVLAWALDRQTGVGVFLQTPMPGFPLAAKFRAEGAPMRLSSQTATLTAEASEAVVSYTFPSAGQEATLIVESNAEGAVSPVTATMRVRKSPPATSVVTMLLARNQLAEFYIGSYTNLSALTVTTSDPDRVLLSPTPSTPGTASLEVSTAGAKIYLHALAQSGNATVLFKSAGETVIELQVALQPLILNIVYTSGVVVPGAGADYTFVLNANALRPNSGPYRFNVQSSNPSVATVDPQSFELGGPSGPLSVTLRVTGMAQGSANLVFVGPPEIVANPMLVSVSDSAHPVLPVYAIGKNLQTAVQLDLGSSFSNPNGAIVKLTSSDPGRLLLSRSVSTPGTASISVAVPAGQLQTQQIFLQAIGEGDAVVQWTANEVTRPAASIQIVRSWVSCGPLEASPVVGGTVNLVCSIRAAASPSNYVLQLAPRPGLGDLSLGMESSAPDIFTVTPRSVSLESGSAQATLRGISPGSAELKLKPPADFGPSLVGSETLAVSVVAPRLAANHGSEIILGKDTQVTYRFSVPAGVPVTAASQDAALLLVSTDARTPGAATASAVSNVGSVDLTVQALAGSGTAEVVFTAPGYQEFRVAVRLRATELYWTNLPYPGNPISLKTGSSTLLTLGVRPTEYDATPRAGSNTEVGILMDRAGIVTLNPSQVVLSGPDSQGQVNVQGAAVGSVVLRISPPPGFTASAKPAFVTVAP